MRDATRWRTLERTCVAVTLETAEGTVTLDTVASLAGTPPHVRELRALVDRAVPRPPLAPPAGQRWPAV